MESAANGSKLRLIRERHPHVCRIMLTADPMRETVIRAVNEGENYRFIPKPWDNTMLRVTVYFAFEGDFPYPAALARQGEAELLLAQAEKAGEGA